MDLLGNFNISIDKLSEIASAQKQRDVDVWLDAINHDDPYGEIITSRLHGTCNWILKHPSFLAWESQTSEDSIAKLLWINAPAGFGKTFLSASLIQHIGEKSPLALAYCFSSSHAQSTQGLDGIARTWITQLVQKEKALLDLTNQIRQKRNTRRASKEDIWVLLKDIAKQIDSCYFVLDGLDEFQSIDDSRRRFLTGLIDAIQTTRLRVLITSRNEFDIESAMLSIAAPGCVILDCKVSRSEVRDDIDLVSQTLVARKLPKQEDNLRQELATAMAERCDGQFLWLKFQQDLLRDSKSAKALREIVQAMPPKLHSVYTRTWDSIQALQEPDRGRAVDILRWLTYAYRPLTVQELAEGLVVSLDWDLEAFSKDDLPNEIDDDYIDGEIKNLCGSFVEVRQGQQLGPRYKTVHLVHASVVEFLIEMLPINQLISPVFENSQVNAAQDAQLAAQCIRFLDCPEVWDESLELSRSFIDYAAFLWYRHLNNSNMFYEVISHFVHNFIKPGNDNFERWKARFEWDIPTTNEHSAPSFYYACLFGLVPAMHFLHNRTDFDVNLGGRLGTPLAVVCAEGHWIAFELLLAWKADVTLSEGWYGTALNAAAIHGRIDMVNALLDYGASPQPLGRDESEGTVTAPFQEDTNGGQSSTGSLTYLQANNPKPLKIPLQSAVWNGHMRVTEVLLERGAFPNIQNIRGETALHLASYWNSLDIVGVLLERGANPNIHNAYGETPLYLATLCKLPEIVELLLERGANPNTQTNSGETALCLATDCNYPEIVEILLERGANVNIQRFDKHTPLHTAAYDGYLDIVTQLIRHKAVVDMPGKHGDTPLHLATRQGHVPIVECLVDEGADLDTQNADGRVPLMFAASYNHLQVVEYLVNAGAKMNTQTGSGLTAIMIATECESLEAAQYLILKGAALTPANNRWTPLHAAAKEGMLGLIDLLVQYGADINAQDLSGRTPLHCAVRSAYPTIVEKLLQKGAAMKADNFGWMPIHAAASRAQLESTALLLDQGADIHALTNQDLTPLDLVINLEDGKTEQQCLEEVKLLLARGAELAPSFGGCTPLHLAADFNFLKVAALCLDRGLDINTQTHDGQTALYIAIAYDSLDTAELLISQGADVSIAEDTGMTPLHSATGKGRLELAQRLVQKGCNVNAVSDSGFSPLQMAITKGSDEVVEYLIESGADLSTMDCYGMKCSDWLKGRHFNSGVPFVSLALQDVSFGPDIAVMRNTVLVLIGRIRENKETSNALYTLAHCCLFSGLDDDARSAYQQKILLGQEDSTNSILECNNCDTRANLEDAFFACKLCPESDLCNKCKEEHDRKAVLNICRNHEFMEVIASEAKFKPSDTEELNKWLDGIVDRIQDCSHYSKNFYGFD